MIYDVAIIGAGPAGATAAHILQQQKHNLILLDKKTFPRSKPCAGILPPKIKTLITLPPKIYERPLLGYRIYPPSNKKVETTFPDHGYIVQREKFDTYLHKTYNIQPIKCTVKKISETKNYYTIQGEHTTYKSHFIIAADGATSTIQKNLNIKANSFAIAAQYELKSPKKIIDNKIGDWFEVYYILEYGYGWISPHKKTVKIGVGILSEYIKNDIWTALKSFMNHAIVKEKLNQAKIIGKEAAVIPMAGPLAQPSTNRVLFAGDAGGFVYPGTGEGIYYAMKSGISAGKTISHTLHENCEDINELQKKYIDELEKNGLMILRDVDFIEKNLSSLEKAENYVKKIRFISR